LKNVFNGITFDGIDDWLEERFRGVIGYIAEMFLDMSKGVIHHSSCLLCDRMDKIMTNPENRRHILQGEPSKDWLREIKSVYNTWRCLCEAGLCGTSPPHSVIFSLILELLCFYHPEENALSLVSVFCSKFLGDPGLDGCLLEPEEILKLRANTTFEATLLTSVAMKNAHSKIQLTNLLEEFF